MNSNSQQACINSFIVELAKASHSRDEIQNIVIRNLRPVYNVASFRHSYSQIFATLKKEVVESDKCSVDFLSANIDTLYELNNSEGVAWNNNIKDKINKLCDHIMLELSRIGYYGNQALQEQYKDVATKLESTKKEVYTASKTVDEAKQRIDSMRTESVTVLSIFAAIMLASLGGLSFLSNTLKSINDVSIFRLVMICSITGFVLFNTTFMLIYMATKITDRSIYSLCLDADEGRDCMMVGKCKSNCWGINRLRKRLPYVFWVNSVLLILVAVNVIAWYIVRYTAWLKPPTM